MVLCPSPGAYCDLCSFREQQTSYLFTYLQLASVQADCFDLSGGTQLWLNLCVWTPKVKCKDHWEPQIIVWGHGNGRGHVALAVRYPSHVHCLLQKQTDSNGNAQVHLLVYQGRLQLKHCAELYSRIQEMCWRHKQLPQEDALWSHEDKPAKFSVNPSSPSLCIQLSLYLHESFWIIASPLFKTATLRKSSKACESRDNWNAVTQKISFGYFPKSLVVVPVIYVIQNMLCSCLAMLCF